MPPKKLKSPKGQPHTTVLSFSVGQNGNIVNAPTFFEVWTGDTVIWFIGNASGQPITVTLAEFLLKDTDTDPKGNPSHVVLPFVWLTSNTVDIDDQKIGIIAGLRDPNYPLHGMHDPVSYNIYIASRAKTNPFPPVVWDPDGDIKP